MSTVTKTEYGLRYPNGPYDWTLQNVTNLLSTDGRNSIQKAYEDNLAALGIKAGEIEWVQRTVTVEYGDPTPLVDTDPLEDANTVIEIPTEEQTE